MGILAKIMKYDKSVHHIASQGDTVEQARDNLREALELFLESASPEEVKERLHSEVFVTQVEVAFG